MADKLIVKSKEGKTIVFSEDLFKFNQSYGLNSTADAIDEKRIKPKGTKLADVQAAFDSFKEIIDEFSQDRLDLFAYIPLTKNGNWNKVKSYLVKASGILIVNPMEGVVSKSLLQLRLVPTTKDGSGSQNGDGNTMLLTADFFDRNDEQEAAIIGEDGSPRKIENKPRNKYLKKEDLKVWHNYEDAKGRRYKFVGSVTHTDYFVGDIEENMYVKLTKKSMDVLAGCKDIDDVYPKRYDIDCSFANLKFVREVD